MAWRVVLIADVPSLAIGCRLLDRLTSLSAVVESRHGAQRVITLTWNGSSAAEAGPAAAEAIRRTLGPELVGEVAVESVEPEHAES